MSTSTERINTVIIGGGQSGLAAGALLARQGVRFIIVDANPRTGDAWRNRWDSLQLFTPARMNGLPGMPFPGRGDRTIGKDEMADYLESYAEHFELPIRHGVRVERLSRNGEGYIVETTDGVFEAEHVIVAMANYQKPKVPEFATELDSAVVQLHSSEYKSPSQLRPGPVLVVGAGNSGADIALELAKTHETMLSGTETGHVPFRIENAFGRIFGIRMVRFLGHYVLTTSTPIGRKVRPDFLRHAGPLVRVKPDDLTAAGVTRVERVVGVRAGMPSVDGQSALPVQNVIWCTGFRTGFSWIDVPILDEHQEPRHDRGIARDMPGLYFLGLNFLHSATSDVITGLTRDATYVTAALVRRTRSRGVEPAARALTATQT